MDEKKRKQSAARRRVGGSLTPKKAARLQEKELAREEERQAPRPKPAAPKHKIASVREPEAERPAPAKSKHQTPPKQKSERPPRQKKAAPQAEEQSEFQVIKGGKGHKSRKLLVFVSIVLVLVLLVGSIQLFAPTGLVEFAKILMASGGSGDGFPVTLSQSSGRMAGFAGGDIALLSDSSLSLYKPNGHRYFERQHGYTNPVLSLAGFRMLTFDRDGTKVRVDNRAEQVGELTMEGPVMTADIGKNGAVAVVSRVNGYLCDVTVYNRRLQQQYIWHSATRQVTSVSVSDSGRYFALGTLTTENGAFLSQLMIFDVKQTEPLFTADYPGSLVISVDFKGDEAVAVLDDRIARLSVKGEKAEVSFDGRKVEAYSNQLSSGAAVVLSQYNQSQHTECLIFDKTLKLLGTGKAEGTVMSVSYAGKYTSLLLRDSLVVFDSSGRQHKVIDSLPDKMLVASSGGKAAVVGSTSLDVVDIS